MPNSQFTSRFIEDTPTTDPTDLGVKYVTKEYMMDVYPELVPNMKAPALWCWGLNTDGQLGDNTIVTRYLQSQTISTGVDWKQINCGGYCSLAIKNNGSLWVWGYNTNGQLGDGTIISKSSPVQTSVSGTDWKQVDSFDSHAMAIKTDGTLWSWGWNVSGQLGDNTVITKSVPVQTSVSGTDWKQVSCGFDHTACIKKDGTLWLWGSNSSSQLADGTIISKSVPVQTSVSGTDWKQVSCGHESTAAIKTDGTLWLWGRNDYGNLGINSTTLQSVPTQTSVSGTDWKQVSCGLSFTAAIKTDGTLWLWGRGDQGQIGNNSAVDVSYPVQTSLGGNLWKYISAGHFHISALKTDGTLWNWGLNDSFHLGINTSNNKSTPIQTAGGGNNWKTIASGRKHTIGISEAQGY